MHGDIMNSMYGRIESGWKVESGVIRYTFTVPANTTATLYLPTASLRDVREKTKPVRKCKGVEFISEGNGEVVLKLLSGSYSFVVRRLSACGKEEEEIRLRPVMMVI